MNLEKVKIKPSHFEDFYELRLDKVNIYWSGHDAPPKKENLQQWFNSQIDSETRNIFMIYSGRQVAGYLYCDHVDDDEMEVALGVHNSLSGRGIGTHIIEYAISEGTERGYKKITAVVAEDNKGSMKVFLRNGFTETDDYEFRFIKMAGKEFKFVKLERSL